MKREIIAIVRLSPGEVGYYDELSRIHLTISNPQRDILAGTNCTQLRRSVKSGRLRLLYGSLGEDKKMDFAKSGNRYTGYKTDEKLSPATQAMPVNPQDYTASTVVMPQSSSRHENNAQTENCSKLNDNLDKETVIIEIVTDKSLDEKVKNDETVQLEKNVSETLEITEKNTITDEQEKILNEEEQPSDEQEKISDEEEKKNRKKK